jgi:hypothetical protein
LGINVLKILDISTPSERAKSLIRIVWIFSIGIIAVTTAYGVIMSVVQGTEIVGQTFVDVEFPPIHIFPIFYMKPVSWLFAAIVAFVFSSLELWKERVRMLSPLIKTVIKTSTFMVCALAFYEVLFNFTLWSGLIGANAVLGHVNPDLIINPFPNPKIPWNIVFATKMYLALVISTAYCFIFINRLEK